jgi:hypothetical protein
MLLLNRYVGVPQLRPLLLQGCLRHNQPFKLQQWTKQSNRLKPQWFSARSATLLTMQRNLERWAKLSETHNDQTIYLHRLVV